MTTTRKGRGQGTKTGPNREYDPAQLRHFAAFRAQRAQLRPVDCLFAAAYPAVTTAPRSDPRTQLCWVETGPPAITPSSRCLGCGGTPRRNS